MLVAVLTGYFFPLVIYMSLLLVHEAGHFIMASYYKWNTDKIYFYPYGGYSKFNDCLNKPLKEELMILIMGPLFQILYYLLLSFLSVKDIEVYHYSILFFNLLPIYPLDGGKLVNILISYKLSYKRSYIITLIFSYIVFLVIAFISIKYVFSLSIALILILLFYKIVESYSKRVHTFNKFLLERYLYNFKFKKTKTIDDVDLMQRDYKHIFTKNGSYYTEKEILKKRYK